MKRSGFCLALVCVLLTPTGCFNNYNPTPPEIVSMSAKITSTTTGVVKLGMAAWAAQNPAMSQVVADQITKNINNVVLPYLDTAQGVSASILEAAMQQQLLDGLPDDVQELINTASSVLDAYLPVPDPTTYLKDWQLAYMKAFLTGVAQGASNYAQPAAKDVVKMPTSHGKWFVPVKKTKAKVK